MNKIMCLFAAFIGLATGSVCATEAVKHLLLDDRVVESLDNAVLRVGQVEKHPANPLFVEDQVWEPRFDNLYPNVIYDEEDQLYKIWYFTWTYDPAVENTPPDQRTPGTYITVLKKYRRELGRNEPRTDGLGYAFSKDGIHWEKPLMSVSAWKGHPSNLVMQPAHGVGVYKDLQERDPARRFKLICQAGWHVMGVAFSENGIHWGERIATPEIEAAGDCHNNALWVPQLNKYVAITRLWASNQRIVGRTESSDFIHWSKAVEVLRGDPQKQSYAMPIFRYGNVYLGLPALINLETDRTQTELAWSPDTITWHRIEPGTALIPNAEQKGVYDWGIVHASRPVLLDNEIRLYYGAGDARHGWDWRKGSLCVATLRPDGFAGYEPEDVSQPAVVITKPIALGGALSLTADAEGGAVRVALLDDRGKVLLTSRPVTTSVTNEPVSWSGNGRLEELAGRQVRLQFKIKKAKLYSFMF